MAALRQTEGGSDEACLPKRSLQDQDCDCAIVKQMLAAEGALCDTPAADAMLTAAA